MNDTGLVQLDMWTFAESRAEAEKAGKDTSVSPLWMSWSADFLARIFPSPANGKVFEKANALVYGGNFFGSLASYDPEWCCWKMSPGLPTKTLHKWGHFDKRMHCWLLVRCPASAMMHNGKLYLLLMPERPIYANDGFAWPTLTAHDFQNRVAPADEKIHVTESGTLKYINETGLSHIRLSQTVKYYEEKADWHTLIANDAEKTGEMELKRENGLSSQVRWATLKAEGNHQKNSRDNHISLEPQVQQWSTPCARDSRTGGYAADLNRHSPNLNSQAVYNPGDKLNPDWCEQLMGFPVGWTDPEADTPVITADGLMTQPFPAPPGAQAAHEVARTTDRNTHRKDRIKALGNGVVPQVVLPIALAMKARLEAEDDLS